MVWLKDKEKSPQKWNKRRSTDQSENFRWNKHAPFLASLICTGQTQGGRGRRQMYKRRKPSWIEVGVPSRLEGILSFVCRIKLWAVTMLLKKKQLNIQKTKIMASSPITSWQIDGETITNFIFLGSKITAHGDCSHEIKRCLLLGRKAMTNIDSILKSRDITLLTKVHLVKALLFPVVMYECGSWTIRKAERQRIDAFELWCWRRLLRVPWTVRRPNQSILKEISTE